MILNSFETKYFLISLLIVFRLGAAQDECQKNSNQTGGLKQTCPLSVGQLSNMISNFAMFMNQTKCNYKNETCAIAWIDQMNSVLGKTLEREELVGYQYEANITDANAELVNQMIPLTGNLSKSMVFDGKRFYNESKKWNETIQRMLYLTRSYLPTNPLVIKMTGIYAKTVVCRKNKSECLSLEPELTELMANSRNYTELLWAWNGWFTNAGRAVKNLFTQYVERANQIARGYDYRDMSEIWIEELEIPNLEKLSDKLYNQIKPFYEQLHAYVRRKLRSFYGIDKLNSSYIPAHILGNMWAQEWSNIFNIVDPFPNTTSYNLTSILINRNFTALKIFEESEDFFRSIGLYPMTPQFWKYSMIVKPKNRNVVCHASAWDFHNGYDYRIKMCTTITADSFYTVHHEMGHIEYDMSYSHQPVIFQKGANSGFHEAIGDTISLSVLTETHLKRIGLLKDFNSTNESNIKFLMKLALSKIAFLPFGYLMDKWRWNVFRGNITPNNYNQEWWDMIKKYQGVNTPELRNETYFDPGGKFHIIANVPYIRYFIADFLQFQFYKSLCQLANHTGPLHTCDYAGSLNAGLKFKEMLSLGSSKHWTYALKLLTGSDKISADAILEYFAPLMEWLKQENSKYPEDSVGW